MEPCSGLAGGSTADTWLPGAPVFPWSHATDWHEDLLQIPGSLEHPSSHGAMQRTGTRIYVTYLAPWSTRLPMEQCNGLARGSTADTWLPGAPVFPWSHATDWQKKLNADTWLPGAPVFPWSHAADWHEDLLQILSSLEHPSSHGAMQRTGTRIYCRYLAPWSTRLPMEPCSGLARGSTADTWLPGAPFFPWSHAADWHEDLLQIPGSLEHPSSHGTMQRTGTRIYCRYLAPWSTRLPMEPCSGLARGSTAETWLPGAPVFPWNHAADWQEGVLQIPGSMEHPSSHGTMQRTGKRIYCRYLAPWSTRLPMEPCSGLARGSTADTWLPGAPVFPWSHAADWHEDLLQRPGSLEHPSSHGTMQRTGRRVYCRYLAPWSTHLPMEPCSGLARGSTADTWLPGAPVFPWSHAADWHKDLLQIPGSLEHPSSHGAMQRTGTRIYCGYLAPWSTLLPMEPCSGLARGSTADTWLPGAPVFPWNHAADWHEDLLQIPGSLEHPSSHGAMQRTGMRIYCRYLAPWSTRLPMEQCNGLARGSTADTWLPGAPVFQ